MYPIATRNPHFPGGINNTSEICDLLNTVKVNGTG